ncbi:hypothetical protein BDV30DRAFT_230183 [Aspergillus minisclerotigenes]|uniref:Uncharacterized protein n=1 Tax=Aspergillus minisclerotigenes TaxID=656917 RepID=A0A5N6IS06_9EURO|nr:hypothetical protein BDV30DRAFT_230183 [Aspergillus minisclerotigenes]
MSLMSLPTELLSQMAEYVISLQSLARRHEGSQESSRRWSRDSRIFPTYTNIPRERTLALWPHDLSSLQIHPTPSAVHCISALKGLGPKYARFGKFICAIDSCYTWESANSENPTFWRCKSVLAR